MQTTAEQTGEFPQVGSKNRYVHTFVGFEFTQTGSLSEAADQVTTSSNPKDAVTFFWSPSEWMRDVLYIPYYQQLRTHLGLLEKTNNKEDCTGHMLQTITHLSIQMKLCGAEEYLRKLKRAATMFELLVIFFTQQGESVPLTCMSIKMAYQLASEEEPDMLAVFRFVIAQQILATASIPAATARKLVYIIQQEKRDEEQDRDSLRNLRFTNQFEESVKQAKTLIEKHLSDIETLQTTEGSEEAINEHKRKILTLEARIRTRHLEFTKRLHIIQVKNAAESKKYEELIAAMRIKEGVHANHLKSLSHFFKRQSEAYEVAISFVQAIYLTLKGQSMTEEARGEYLKFITYEMENCGKNTIIDRIKKIICVVKSRDANRFFEIASEGKSRVCFDNDNDNSFNINNEFKIDTTAIDQIKTNDLREALRLTHDFNETKGKNTTKEQQAEDEREYVKAIAEIFKNKYRMITKTEIEVFQKEISDLQFYDNLSDEQKTYLLNMTPSDAYRMREVFSGFPKNDGNFVKAAFTLAKKEKNGTCADLSNAMAVIKIFTIEKMKQPTEEPPLTLDPEEEAERKYWAAVELKKKAYSETHNKEKEKDIVDKEEEIEIVNIFYKQIIEDLEKHHEERSDTDEALKKEYLEYLKELERQKKGQARKPRSKRSNTDTDQDEDIANLTVFYEHKMTAINKLYAERHEQRKAQAKQFHGSLPRRKRPRCREELIYEKLLTKPGMDELIKMIDDEMKIIEPFASTAKYKFSTKLATFYHNQKHAAASFTTYHNGNPPENPTKEQLYEVYNKTMMEEFVRVPGKKRRQRISQDGERITYFFEWEGNSSHTAKIFAIRKKRKNNWDYTIEDWDRKLHMATHF